MSVPLFCPYCGHSNLLEAKFCAWCSKGLPIIPANVAPATPSALPVQQPAWAPSGRAVTIFVGVIVVLALFFAILANVFRGQELDRLFGVGTPQRMLAGKLADSNRQPVRRAILQVSGGEVEIWWNIEKASTDEAIVSNAKQDAISILAAVKQSGIRVNRVELHGRAAMRDKLGNSKNQEVIDVSYTGTKLDAINLGGIDADDIFLLADFSTIHPQFR